MNTSTVLIFTLTAMAVSGVNVNVKEKTITQPNLRSILKVPAVLLQNSTKCGEEKNICTREPCVHVASRVHKMLNKQISPCRDFYKFACGGWQKDNLHQINDENIFYGNHLHEMQGNVNTFLKLLIAGKIKIYKEFYESGSYKKLTTFHDSCLDVETIKSHGYMPVWNLLKSLKAFQISGPFKESKWNLTEAVLELIRLNGTPLFEISFDTDSKNATKFGLLITKPQHYGLVEELLQTHRKNFKPTSEVNQFVKGRAGKIIQKLFKDTTDHNLLRDLLAAIRGNTDLEPEPNQSQRQFLPSGLIKRILSSSSNNNYISTIEKKTPEFSADAENDIENELTTLRPDLDGEEIGATMVSNGHDSSAPDGVNEVNNATSNKSSFDDLVSFLEAISIAKKEQAESSAKIQMPVLSRRVLYQSVMDEVTSQKRLDLASIIELYSTNCTDCNFFTSSQENTPEIVDFIMNLQEIEPTQREQMLYQQQGDIFNNIYTLSQLNEEFPVINWNYLLSELLNETVENNFNVSVYFPDYMRKMSRIISNTEPWLVHHGMVTLFISDLLTELVTVDAESKRDDYCLDVVKMAFPDIITHMYLKRIGVGKLRYLQEKLKPMVNQIMKEALNLIENSELMSTADKTTATNKIQNLDWQIGGLEDLDNITYVEKSYEGVNIEHELYFDNVMSLYTSIRKELYEMFYQPIDKNVLIWQIITDPFTVNAFYTHSTNSIVMPEAILRPPFFNLGSPDYLNYGSIGTAMAHEMFHALDFAGIKFTSAGIYNSSLFSEQMNEILTTNLRCFEDLLTQSFTHVSDMGGLLVLMDIDHETKKNENFADLAGLEVTYNAYKASQSLSGSEPLLPSVPFTRDQMFFISYAQPYCGIFPPFSKVVLLELDEHLTGDLRLNSLFTNFKAFQGAFGCSTDDKMTSETQCSVF